MRNLILHIVLFLLIFPRGNAQDYITKLTHYSVLDGLSSNTINQFLEDQRGFVWIATKEGINRFDGEKFKYFLTEDNEFQSNNCAKIVEDVNGNIWSRFLDDSSEKRGKFYYLITQQFKVIPIEKHYEKLLPFSTNEIHSIHQHYNNELYLLTKSGSIYRFDGQFKKIATDKRFTNGLISNITANGDIIFIHKNWTIQLNENGKIINEEPQAILDEYLYKNIDLKPSNLALFSNGYFQGVRGSKSTFAKSNLPFIKKMIAPLKPNMDIRLIRKYLDATMFFLCISKDHLMLLDSNGREVYKYSENRKKGNNNLNVGSKLLLKKNQIWFKTISGFSILEYQKSIFHHYFKKSYANDCRAIYPIEPNKLLALDLGGIEVIDTEKDTAYHYSAPKGLGFSSITKISNEAIIIGCSGPNLLKFNLQTNSHQIIFVKKAHQNNLGNGKFAETFRDSQNNFWIGSTKGIAQYLPASDSIVSFDNYNKFSHLQSEAIYFIAEYEDGLWFSTSDGLYLMNKNQELVKHFELIKNMDSYHFYREGDVFWITTYGKGLVKWNKKTSEIKNYRIKDGFLSNYLTAVYPDENNNLWIATEMGLAKFNKTTEDIFNFLESDGLTNNEFNRYSHFQAPDGRIYFGGINGINAFYPKDLDTPTQNTSRFVITDYFQLDGDEGKFVEKTADFFASKKIRLDNQNKSFRLHFSLLNYKHTHKTQYTYLIEGLDKDWNYQSENYLRINNLPYGNYKLKIKAKDYSGVWNKNEISIPIFVEAPFYQKLHFQLLILILFGLLVFIIQRLRIRALKKTQENLETQVTERTSIIETQKQELTKLNESLNQSNQTKDRLFGVLAHDLKNAVLSFQNLSTSFNYLLKRKDEKRINELGSFIEKEAQQLHLLLDDLLTWSLSQRNELNFDEEQVVLSNLVSKILEKNKHIAEISEVALKQNVRDNLIINTDPRILETVFRNLLNNAFRYTKKGGWISIEAVELKQLIEIKIIDNGVGMNKDKLENLFKVNKRKSFSESKKHGSVSFGLFLCKELIELIGGKISAESEFGKGTVFKLELSKKEV